MYIQKRLIPKSKWKIKAPYIMKASSVTAHNTYNDALATSEVAYMTSNNNKTSFHFAVDHERVIQGIETNRNAWHAGDGNGNGNRRSIGVEICFSKSGGNRFVQAEKNGAKLCAYLLKVNGLTIKDLKKHQDWSGKYCPHRTLDMGWNRFVNMVRKELGVVVTSKPSTPSTMEYYSMYHNSRHSNVKKLQLDLQKLGFNPGEIDGIFGAKTDSAVRSFQRTNGLVVDGSVGTKTLRELELMLAKKPSRTYFQRGDEGPKVRKIQEDLLKLGGYRIEANGIYDSNTRDKITIFQQRNGLVADGIAGTETLRKLDNLLKAQDALLYKVQVGAFTKRENAEKLLKELKKQGFNGFVKKD